MTNKDKLLKGFWDKKLSWNTITTVSEKFPKDMTDQQREERAGQIFNTLKESKTEKDYDKDGEYRYLST